MADSPPNEPFAGAKLLLRHAGGLLTILRDDRPGLPFADHWDLPGGGREGGESPLACALRELSEELSLALPPDRLTAHRVASHARPGMASWLFAGDVTAAEIGRIVLGHEGQCWRLMPVARFMSHPRAIAHQQDWIRPLVAPHRPAGASCRP